MKAHPTFLVPTSLATEALVFKINPDFATPVALNTNERERIDVRNVPRMREITGV